MHGEQRVRRSGPLSGIGLERADRLWFSRGSWELSVLSRIGGEVESRRRGFRNSLQRFGTKFGDGVFFDGDAEIARESRTARQERREVGAPQPCVSRSKVLISSVSPGILPALYEAGPIRIGCLDEVQHAGYSSRLS